MSDKWRCNACGYIQDGGILLGYCPSCGAKGQMFLTTANNVQQIEEVELTDETTTWKGHEIADNMSAYQIENYLKDIISVEKSINITQLLLKRIKNTRPKEPDPPVPPECPHHMKNLLNILRAILSAPISTIAFAVTVISGCVALFIFFSVVLFIYCAVAITYPDSWDVFCAGTRMIGIVIGGGCVLVLLGGAVLLILEPIKKYNAENKEYIRLKHDYEEEVKGFPQKQLHWECLISLWSQDCKRLETALEESEANLKEMYSKDVLYYKYRNLVAVCSLLEYFQSGTCETMSAAYNKYDTELQLGHIIGYLNKIWRSIEDIKHNQLMLYSVLQSSNQQLNQLVQQTSNFYAEASNRFANMELSAHNLETQVFELSQTSAITAYCSEETKKELSFIRRMGQYEGIIGSSWPV